MKRILIVEPYYGGSHKQFLDGLVNLIPADFTLLTLPARKWKMRMQVAAPWAVQQLEEMSFDKRWFDLVICSTFIDVALFRALTVQLPGWNMDATIHIYLHENQFAYPSRIRDPGYFQFTSINFNSCLAADSLAFNSSFNLETFLSGCRKFLKSAADMKLDLLVDRLRSKSTVLHPGLNFDALDNMYQIENSGSEPPVIVWNHRWEHDKNPEEFFDALGHLQKKGYSFGLIVLGQSFANKPDCFVYAEKKFTKEIIHFGFVDHHEEYLKLLCQCDIVVSTAIHEFYGIAVIEAVRAGCIPVLPNRLSYPELFDNKYLYNSGKLLPHLELTIKKNERLSRDRAKSMTDVFSWRNLQKKYRNWLFGEIL